MKVNWEALDIVSDVIGCLCIVLSLVVILGGAIHYKSENIKLLEQIEELQNKELSCKSYCEVEFEKMGC